VGLLLLYPAMMTSIVGQFDLAGSMTTVFGEHETSTHLKHRCGEG
jgi:hypothetical protein